MTRPALRRLAACVIRQPPWLGLRLLPFAPVGVAIHGWPNSEGNAVKCCTSWYGDIPDGSFGWWVSGARSSARGKGAAADRVTTLSKNSRRVLSVLLRAQVAFSRTVSQRRSGPGSLDEIECNLMFRDAVCSLQNRRLLSDCVHALRTHETVDTAIPSADTVIPVRDAIDTSGLELIDDVPPRQLLRRGQTLRCFRLSLISRTHDGACRTPTGMCAGWHRPHFARQMLSK